MEGFSPTQATALAAVPPMGGLLVIVTVGKCYMLARQSGRLPAKVQERRQCGSA